MPYHGTTVGYQTTDTSFAAAKKIHKLSGPMRGQVLLVLKEYEHGLTGDEIAALLKQSVLSIRPRLTELRRENLITDSGMRRQIGTGVKTIVWMLNDPARP